MIFCYRHGFDRCSGSLPGCACPQVTPEMLARMDAVDAERARLKTGLATAVMSPPRMARAGAR